MNTALLKNETAPYEDEYAAIMKTAQDLGFTIQTDGELPKSGTEKTVVYCAVRECMVNTMRHAEGDTLFVRCRNGRYVFTNNGKPPVTDIREKGGLANLRRLAQDSGWCMEIRSLPVFELTLYQGEEEENV